METPAGKLTSKAQEPPAPHPSPPRKQEPTLTTEDLSWASSTGAVTTLQPKPHGGAEASPSLILETREPRHDSTGGCGERTGGRRGAALRRNTAESLTATKDRVYEEERNAILKGSKKPVVRSKNTLQHRQHQSTEELEDRREGPTPDAVDRGGQKPGARGEDGRKAER